MQDEQLSITIADINDAGLLTELGITIFRDTFATDNKQEDMDKYVAEEMNINKISAEISDPRNTFFIARLGSIAVGYAKIRDTKIPKELANKHPLEIERLYVMHEYHSRKIGAALMAHCITTARSRGYDVIWLGVWEHNHKAINFYKKWGFELFGAHAFILGNDRQTDVLMQLTL